MFLAHPPPRAESSMTPHKTRGPRVSDFLTVESTRFGGRAPGRIDPMRWVSPTGPKSIPQTKQSVWKTSLTPKYSPRWVP